MTHFTPTIGKYHRDPTKERKPNSRGYTIVQYKKACELYKQGKTVQEICNELNMQNNRVRDILQIPKQRNRKSKHPGVKRINDAEKWWKL